MRVLGVDIEAGKSPNSSQPPSYAVVIINEKGEIEEKYENVSIGKLIRIIWEKRPEVIATDNVYELASNEKQLIKLLSLLPDNLQIIQTTYINGQFKDIREVARENGIDIQGKTNPLKTAYLAALLALKGLGTPIKAIENKTKIIISRGRALGPGGMSSNRYKRHIRGLVLRVMKEIKEKLDKNGFDYDYTIKRTKAGVEKAVFIVYAPRQSLNGIIKKMKGHDLVVDIKPIFKSKIEFVDKEKFSRKPIIVGIDPGIEVGISIIDLYANPVYLNSKRNIDREEIINIIRQNGKPVLIATDVNPVPDTVRKIAAQLRCKIYEPERPLYIDEKMELVSKFSEMHKIKIDDPHIRDSLSAALKAYYDFSHKLRQIEGFLGRLDLDIEEDKIIECVINGNTINECIEKEIEKEVTVTTRIEQPKTIENKQISNSAQSINNELLEYKKENERLKRYIKQLLQYKEYLEHRIDEIKASINIEVEKDRRVYELHTIISTYLKQIASLKDQIENKDKEISKLKEIIRGLIYGDKTALHKSQLPPYFKIEKNRIIFADQEISSEILDLIIDDYVILEKTLLRDLELLNKERLMNIDTNIDLKRIIDEYRKQRFRTA
ncbi:DUF460 domain-containing protein [Sulfurisphaera ohwakuensis]|uniref:DUF460 domain-containing protein n=1 Tax=Sulfurisphaera ohwakuensis TaxID=69656 RepID=A0A650CDL4_SULOH|nr:DUF460 domain-containing protein [Sulfurisphaera ohwakuensis]MBB5253224.1 hypothetical protein [Sulfurisphaera ohwakuensis]QGR15868.1 DUF460 domain-containing protein [Sulfurisphaera ohwakuensis]